MRIAIPLYDRFTALDAVGPYEVLSRLPGASVTWLAHEPGVVRNDSRMLGVEAQAAFVDLPDPEIVLEDERLIGWIRQAHKTSQWTTSVCTGSLLLGAARRVCSTAWRPPPTGSTCPSSSATEPAPPAGGS